MTIPYDPKTLIEDYTPLLVLYPEIPENSVREKNPNYPHDSPLEYDYHPRDVKLVLENAAFHSRLRLWKSKKTSWQQMLDKMQSKGYEKDIDLLPATDPDNREAFWSAYAAIPKNRPDIERACYARVVPGKGGNKDQVVVQYWYPYFYNDFWNTHEMDWETVMVVLRLTGEGPKPTICAYSAHLGGHWLPWPEVKKANDDLECGDYGTHPVAFVANGSHANYFFGPGMYSTAPPLVAMAANLRKSNRRLVDYTTSWDEGSRHLVEAQQIPPDPVNWTGDWRWLHLKGRWGSPGKWLDLEFGDSGPHGPSRAGDRWDFPFRWIDTHCTRAPSENESLVPTRI